MSSLMFPQVVCVAQEGVGRSSRAEGRMRAWSSPGPLAVKAGSGEGSVNRGQPGLPPGPRDRPRTRVGGAAPVFKCLQAHKSHLSPRQRCGPSFTTALTRPRVPRPSPAHSGAALLWCRRGAVRVLGVQNGVDQPRAPCSATPKHIENTPKTPGRRMVSWRHPRHRGFNLLRFGQIRPNKHGPHESSSREFLLSHNRRPTLHHRPVDRELRPRGRIEVH